MTPNGINCFNASVSKLINKYEHKHLDSGKHFMLTVDCSSSLSFIVKLCCLAGFSEIKPKLYLLQGKRVSINYRSSCSILLMHIEGKTKGSYLFHIKSFKNEDTRRMVKAKDVLVKQGYVHPY